MKRLIFAGIVVFLVVLLVSFPARVAYQWFAPEELQLSGINGSIWNGSATEALVGGAYVRDIEWEFLPAELLTGSVAFTARANPGSGTFQTNVGAGFDGSLSLTGLQGSVPLDLVHPQFQRSGIRGDVILDFEQLTIRNGFPVHASGNITVADFFAPVLSASQIGDFRADFVTSNDTITGTVKDLSGVLKVDGTIEIGSDRSYVFIGDVAPTPQTPPSITNQLQYLGTPDANGRRPFRFEGRL